MVAGPPRRLHRAYAGPAYGMRKLSSVILSEAKDLQFAGANPAARSERPKEVNPAERAKGSFARGGESLASGGPLYPDSQFAGICRGRRIHQVEDARRRLQPLLPR
jgi:hypothetical protein